VQRGIGLGAACAGGLDVAIARCSSNGGVVMSQTRVGRVVEQLIDEISALLALGDTRHLEE
jgi:hypothetical protein